MAAVSVTKDVQRRDVELQSGGNLDPGVDPRHGDGAKDVAVRKGDEPRVAMPRDELDELLRPGVDLLWSLAARTAVSVDVPVRVRFVDLLRGQSLVAAVVDLSQQRSDLRIVESGELGGSPRPLQRAGENGVELDPCQPFLQGSSLRLASWCERKVGDAGVLT